MDILNQFGVKPILLAAQVVNFLILLFILKRFLYKPILRVLAERKKKIEDSLKNAEEIERRLLQTNEDVEKILAKALTESQKIVNQSKEAGMQIVEGAKETAAQIIQKAAEQALEVQKTEKVKLEQEIRVNLGSLVALVLEKITGKQITTADQKEIVEREIRNLS